MLRVVRVADFLANMVTIENELAGLSAATLRGLFEVLGTSSFYLSVWMILTVQGQSFPNLVVLPQSLEDVAPQFHFAKCCTAANKVETFPGTRQSYTDAIGDAQKTNFTLHVAADQRQQDNVILFSLVLVNYMHLDPCELAGRHKFVQTVELAVIGRKDGNLLWFVVLKEKIAAKSDYKHGLMLVLVACPISDFFWIVVLHKEYAGFNALDLFKVQHRGMIFQLWVDVWGQKTGNFWPHTMLVVEPDKRKSHLHQSFKHGDLHVVSLPKFVNRSTGLQLLVVSDEDEMLACFAQCGDGVGLENLCSLFYDHQTWTHFLQNSAVFCCPCCCHANNLGFPQDTEALMSSHISQSFHGVLIGLFRF